MSHDIKEIVITRVTKDDLQTLQMIGSKTFAETFASSNSSEDMKQYLVESFSLDKLAGEINNQDSTFYLATFDNNVIGYLKLNKGQSQTDVKDGNSLEIERIYVLKEYHGKRAGQLLYDKAMEVAMQLTVSYVWLGVWEKNPRAINFYKKNGFVEFNKHIFRLGNDEQTDIMMRKEI
jgi:diamine N-acetyltransferase